MPTTFSDYLNNHYNPQANVIGDWLDDQATMRAIAQAQMLEYARQRMAAAAAAQQADPIRNQIILPPASAYAPVAAAATGESPSFGQQFFGRAVPQTQATLAEGAALLGHILGADEFRDDMFGYAKEKRDVAAQTPHTVENFSDIRSFGDLGTYLFENAVDQIPNALAMATGAGVGALGAKAATSLASRALSQALTKEAASTAMRRAALGGSFTASGALEGGSAYGTDVQKHGVEGASPLMDLATGAVAGSLDMLGPVSGTFAKVLGKPVTATATRRALRNLSSEKATKTILKGLGKGAKGEGITEALQELVQVANEKAQDGDYRFTAEDMGRLLEAGFLGGVLGAPFGVSGRFIDKRRAPGQLAEINKDIQQRWDARGQQRAEREAARQAALQEEFRGAMNAPRYTPFEDTVDTFYQQTPTITPSNAYSYPSRPFAEENDTVDSFLAGNPFGESAAFPTTPDTFYQSFDVRSPQEKAFDETNQAAARLRTTMRSAEDVVKQESALQKTRLAADARDIMRQLAIVESSNMNAKQKKQAVKDLNKQLAANRAQQIKVDEATKKRTDAIQKTLATKEKQLANNYIEDAVIRRDQQGLTRNPFEFTRLIQMREQAKALYQRQATLLRERLQKVNRQIRDAERNLTRTQSQIAPEGLPGQESFSKTAKATAKMFNDQIAAARKERVEISNRLRKMASAFNRIDASIQQYSEGKGRPTFIQSDLDDLFDGGVQNTPTKADQVAMTALRDSLDAYAQQQAKQRLSESVAERTEARRTKSDVRKYKSDADYRASLEEEWNKAAANREQEINTAREWELNYRSPFPTTTDAFYQNTPVVGGQFDETPDTFYNQTPEVTPGTIAFDETPDTFYQNTPRVTPPLNIDDVVPSKKKTSAVEPDEIAAPAAEQKLSEEEQQAAKELALQAKIKEDTRKAKVEAYRNLPKGMVRNMTLHKRESALEKRHQNAYKHVQRWVDAVLKKFPKLQGIVHVIPNSDNVDPSVVNYLGYFGTDGHIYLNAYNLSKAAHGKRADLKKETLKTLVHEGVIHYGLRVIMNPQQYTKIMENIARSMVNSSYRHMAMTRAGIEYWDALNLAQKGEEILATMAEYIPISKLLKDNVDERMITPNGNVRTEFFGTAWDNFRSWIRAITKRLYGEVSGQDAHMIIRAAAHRLSDPTARISRRVPLPEQPLARTLDMEREAMTRTERAEAEAAQRFPFSNKVKELWDNRGKYTEKFLEQVTDSYRPIERMIKSLKDMGVKTPEGKNRVTYETNVWKNIQHVPGKIAQDLEKYTEFYVQPLLDKIIATAKPGERNEVTFARATDYVEAVAGLERNTAAEKRGYDGPPVSGKSNEYWQSVIDKYQSDKMDAILDELQRINNERIRLLREYKIVPNDILDAWQAKYKYYMPFKSWENIVQEASPEWYKSSARRSFSLPGVQKKITTQVTGREGEAQNNIVHAILQLFDVAALTHKVDIGRQLLELAQTNIDAGNILRVVTYREKGDKDWGRPRTSIDPVTGEKTTTVYGSLKKVVDKKTGEISLVQTKHDAEGEIPNSVAVIDNDGNVQRVVFTDPNVAQAFKGENIYRTSGLIRTIGTVQHVMGKYITSRNPLFWIRNPLRDAVSAAINISSLKDELQALGITDTNEISKQILFKGVGKAWSNNSVRGAIQYYLKHGTLDKANLTPEVREYMSEYERFVGWGSQTKYYGLNNYDALKKGVVDMMNAKNPTTRYQKAKNVIDEMMQTFDNISDSLENMTRYIAFKEIVDALKPYAEAGKTPSGRPLTMQEVYSRASNIALNLTVNFSRRGAMAPLFNSLYMFSSASIGGNVRMLETIFRKNRSTGKTDWRHLSKFMMYPLLAYTLQAVLARGIMGEDEDGVSFYDKIPDYIKSSNLIIPNPMSSDGGYVKIPLPLGFDMFWNLAQKVVDTATSYALGTPGPTPNQATASIIGKVFNNFSPIGGYDEGWTAFVPSVVRPLVQLATNRNFAGNPIMPEGNLTLRGEVPDHLRYWSSANPAVIALTEMMSPILDVSPESIEHLANAYLGGIGRLTFSTLGFVTDVWNGKPVNVGKVPVLGTLYQDKMSDDTNALFSKLRADALTQITAIDEMRKTPGISPEERREVILDNLQGYRVKGALNKVQNSLNDLREQERKILRNPNLTSKQKSQRLEIIRQQKQKQMKQFIKAANAQGIRGI